MADTADTPTTGTAPATAPTTADAAPDTTSTSSTDTGTLPPADPAKAPTAEVIVAPEPPPRVIYATFDANGLPTGYYPSDVFVPDGDNKHPGIPDGALVIAEADYNTLVANAGARAYVGGKVVAYTPPPAPVVIPETLSARQFMQQCVVNGDVTWAEAKAFASVGTIPSKIQAAFDQVPADQRDQAEFVFISADTFDRHNPETVLLGQLMGKSDAQLDDLWTKGSLL